MIIRHATAADAAGIAAIYNDAVRHTTAVLVDHSTVIGSFGIQKCTS